MRTAALFSRISIGLITAVIAVSGTVALALDNARMDSEVAGTLQQFYKLAPDRNQYLV